MSETQSKTFTLINYDELVHIFEAARKHVIYAARSVSKIVAQAQCNFNDNNKNAALRVIIDSDPEAFRLEFGEQGGIKLLAGKAVAY